MAKYASTTGNDSNPGTFASPFRSFQKLCTALTLGEQGYMRGGAYGGVTGFLNSSVHAMVSGTSYANAPTVQAYDGEPVELVTFNPSGECINLATSTLEYRIFKDFTVNAVNCKFGISGTNGCKNIRFQDVTITASQDSGVIVGAGSMAAPYLTNWEFLDCHSHTNGDSHFDHGYYFSTSGNLVQGGSVYNNSSFGIHIFSETVGGVTKEFKDNVIDSVSVYDNATVSTSAANILLSNGTLGGYVVKNCDIWGAWYGVRISNRGTNNAVIYNNLIDGASISGVYLANPTVFTLDGNKIKNNLLTNHAQYGIQIESAATNTEIGNNLYFGNTTGDLDDNGTGLVDDGNHVTADPLYTDRTNDDFSLLTGSPAINAGQTLVSVDVDINGLARPQGVAYDIGPREFAAVGPNVSDSVTVGDTPSVNIDAPINQLPGAQTVITNTQTAIPSVEVVCATANLSSVRLTVMHGTLEVTAQGSATVS